VNAYYKIENLHATIADQAQHYLLNKTIDFDLDHSFEQTVEQHNRYVEEIYTSKFVKNSHLIRVKFYTSWITYGYKEMMRYKELLYGNDLKKLIKMLETVKKTIDFLEHLYQLKQTKLTPKIISLDELNNQIKFLQLNKSETFVFASRTQDMMNRGFMKIDGFDYDANCKNANGILRYSLYIPVHFDPEKCNHITSIIENCSYLYDNEDTITCIPSSAEEGCISRHYLPSFFVKKGNDI
jgi:hypothetical protein